MIRAVKQDSFAHEPFLDDELVLIHKHSLDIDSSTLVLFIHGFCGDPAGTWQNFPNRFFDDKRLHTDVGMIRYLSGTKRLFQLKGSRPVDIEKQVADAVRNCGYQSIIVVGHSMGGLIAKGAVHEYLEGGRDTKSVRFGFIFIASPHAGSGWARIPLALSDIQYLRKKSPQRRATNDYFFQRVWGGYGSPPEPLDRHLPSCSVVAAGDKIVDRISAEGKLQGAPMTTVPGSHTSVVKQPLDLTAAFAVDWCVTQAEIIREIIETPPATASSPPQLAEEIVTVFSHSCREWDDAYSEARAEIESLFGVEVIDQVYATDAVVELALHIFDHSELRSEKTTFELLKNNKLQYQQKYYYLGISPFGGSPSDADYVRDLIKGGPPGARRWVEETADHVELRSELVRWLAYVARNRPKNPRYYRSGSVRNSATLDAELRGALKEPREIDFDPRGYI